MNRRILIALLAVGSFICPAVAQKVALKTNLLYDATSTMNLGFEFGLSPKWTLDVSGNYNPWTFSKNKKWQHWLVQPEARYWFCNKMMGSFIGFHALGGSHNIGNVDLDFKFLGTDFSKLKDYRYEGWFVGAGVAYGYTGLSPSIGTSRLNSEWDTFIRNRINMNAHSVVRNSRMTRRITT